ncbi:unnamed protein product [Orchesella dallaii]|uniref:Dehydrogenase/reductase SDR family member on chromosome X n=1 Tax=Orchesella dallaii TaxID=48710 RepID=A0ABP1S718_9HEXA
MSSKPTSIKSVPPGAWYKRLLAYLFYDCIYFWIVFLVAAWKEISARPPKLDTSNLPKRTGDVAVITGGPRGIAAGIVKRLVELDFTIVMGARNIKESQRRLDELAKSNPSLSFKNVIILEMELMSLSSVKKFANEVLSKYPRIHLMLCNAAIMKVPYQVTEDGFESTFQVNYLSDFLLTHLLLDRLKATARSTGSPCQIIYSSSMIYPFAKVDFNELETSTVYTPLKAYFPTKLYQVMSMLALERRLVEEDAQVHCYAVHPGMIPTDVLADLVGDFLDRNLKRIMRTIENGADTILWPAFCADYQHRGGLYMEHGSSIPIAKSASDKKAQATLFAKSQELVSAFL